MAAALVGVVLGALVGLGTTLVLETWKYRRNARVAAQVLASELAFHGSRLSLAQTAHLENAEFNLVLAHEAWEDQRVHLLRGSSKTEGNAVTAWYSLLSTLGYQIGHEVFAIRGQELTTKLAGAIEAVEARMGQRLADVAPKLSSSSP